MRQCCIIGYEKFAEKVARRQAVAPVMQSNGIKGLLVVLKWLDENNWHIEKNHGLWTGDEHAHDVSEQCSI